MKPEVFDEFCSWLARTFDVRPLSGLGGQRSDRPVAVISFDDGYHDFIEYALPILSKHSLPCNLNVIPQCAETGLPIWNVRLYDLLNAAPVETINQIDLPGFEARLGDKSPGAKIKFGLAISRFLKNRPRVERQKLWQNIESLMKDRIATTKMLSTDEIKDLPDSVEIGAHSFSHESMGFETNDFFEKDLKECKVYFDEKLKKPLNIYAFPNGSYRESQIDLLRKGGVNKILLVGEAFADPARDVLERRTMYGDSLNEVKMHALGY